MAGEAALGKVGGSSPKPSPGRQAFINLAVSDRSPRPFYGHRRFLGSLHGTLNHLLLIDRLWLKRFTGEGEHLERLDAILYEDRAELTRARIIEDDRLITVVETYDESALTRLHSYRTTSGMPQSQALGNILLHRFNHQTHHRGQAHACLSILKDNEPPSQDLLVFRRAGLRQSQKGADFLSNRRC